MCTHMSYIITNDGVITVDSNSRIDAKGNICAPLPYAASLVALSLKCKKLTLLNCKVCES